MSSILLACFTVFCMKERGETSNYIFVYKMKANSLIRSMNNPGAEIREEQIKFGLIQTWFSTCYLSKKLQQVNFVRTLYYFSKETLAVMLNSPSFKGLIVRMDGEKRSGEERAMFLWLPSLTRGLSHLPTLQTTLI